LTEIVDKQTFDDVRGTGVVCTKMGEYGLSLTGDCNELQTAINIVCINMEIGNFEMELR